MPYLTFKGFDSESVRGMLPALRREFSHAAQVPPEIVKVGTLQVCRLPEVARALEILMFPRPQVMHDAIARTLHRLLREHGYRDVRIYFALLAPDLYYKDGAPLRQVAWLPGCQA